jgi:putative peptidoglycan lipid II flippase
MLKSGSRLTALTFISRILGLVREMTKAAFLGTSALSDAFTVAYTIPNLLRKLFAENSVSVAFVPTFKQYLDGKPKQETEGFLSAIFTLMTFLTTVTVAVGIVASPLLVRLFATDEPVEAAFLAQIMFPYLAFISIAALFQGILNGFKIFSPSGFTPILFNGLCLILTYALAPRMANPARAMAVGVLAGGFAQLAFQVPFVMRRGYRFGLTGLKKAFDDPGTKTVIRLIGPTIVGMAVYQLNDSVSTILAGLAGTGVASSITYSLRLMELILGLFVASIGTVILPDLTERAFAKDRAAFNDILLQAIRIVSLITIPVIFYSLVSGEGIIALVYKSRNFDDASVALTLGIFRWHILGLFFIGVNRVVAPAFYAQGDTVSPMKAGTSSFAANIALAVALVFPMKGGGIALALSIAGLVNTVMLARYMKRNGFFDVGSLLRPSALYALRMVAFSAIAALPIWLLRDRLYAAFAHHGKVIAQGVPLALSFMIFASIGAVLLFASRDPVTSSLVALMKRKLKK